MNYISKKGINILKEKEWTEKLHIDTKQNKARTVISITYKIDFRRRNIIRHIVNITK